DAAETIQSIGYGQNDVLVPFEINVGASSPCHRDTRGRLWFSMVEGFAVLDPSAVHDMQPPMLRTYIEQVGTGGEARQVADASMTRSEEHTSELQSRENLV